MFRRRLFYPLILMCLALAATPALAAKGGSSSYSGTIALGQVTGAASTRPALGSAVSFTTSYSSNVKNPRIGLVCYQGGEAVYAEQGSVDHTFSLGGSSSAWLTNGGPASCTATLFDLIWNGNNPQQVVLLASTAFDAAG